jgi:putative colanic acid biosynthesis acetyltransferase WcaB
MSESFLLQDWGANRGNPKGRLFLLSFRLAQQIRRAWGPIRVVGLPYLVFHRLVWEWTFGIELPWGTRVGSGLRIFHGVGLVVSDRSVIGRNVILRHGVTIGIKETQELGCGDAPILGDLVDVGANAIILGAVRIGDRAVIGAGAVVLADVPAGAIAVGNPARVVRVAPIVE